MSLLAVIRMVIVMQIKKTGLHCRNPVQISLFQVLKASCKKRGTSRLCSNLPSGGKRVAELSNLKTTVETYNGV